jgi:hypothetical protein
MRLWLGLSFLLLVLTGCGPELSKTDLGRVDFELPKVADPDSPHPMPELGPVPKPGDMRPKEQGP